MAAYARTPSALTWLCVNRLINGLHKQISCKNCLYAVNLYFTIAMCTMEITKNCEYKDSLSHSYIITASYIRMHVLELYILNFLFCNQIHIKLNFHYLN